MFIYFTLIYLLLFHTFFIFIQRGVCCCSRSVRSRVWWNSVSLIIRTLGPLPFHQVHPYHPRVSSTLAHLLDRQIESTFAVPWNCNRWLCPSILTPSR